MATLRFKGKPFVKGITDEVCLEDYLISVLSVPVVLVGFSVRAQNVFRKARIVRLFDLVVKTRGKLLKRRNFGKKTLAEIESLLNQFRLSLGMQFDSDFIERVKGYSSRNGNDDVLLGEIKEKFPIIFDRLQAARVNGIPKARIDFFVKCFEAYKQSGTLAEVGKVVGLTKERVRQLLVKGSKLGLFEYKPREYPFIPRQKLLEDYGVCLSVGRVAKANNISTVYLQKLFTAYSITENELRKIYLSEQKKKCVEAYERIRNQLNHYPTTTELQEKNEWRYLAQKITRLWGSFDSFRDDLGIPKPPKGSPTFSEDTREWREYRQRIALVVRMECLDRIRECLSKSGSLRCLEVASLCNLRPPVVLRFLNLLLATDEVKREGEGSSIRYRLLKNRGE